MNIKKHYSSKMHLYLHQTIISLVIFALIMLPAFVRIPFLPVAAAGLICLASGLWFLAKYGYYYYRISSLPGSLMKSRANSVQLILLPSPNDENLLYFYSSNGACAYTVERKKGRGTNGFQTGLLITDHKTENEWSLLIGKNEVGLLTEGTALSIQKTRRSKREEAYELGTSEFLHCSSPYQRQICKNGQPVATIQKGEMPLPLQAYYSSNAPLIKLDSRLTNEEKMFCLGLLASEY